jgi:hypothetical protein
MVPDAPGEATSTDGFGVILSLDDTEGIDVTRLQGDTVGSAAICTESAKFSHIIRKVMIRMESWTNYVFP